MTQIHFHKSEAHSNLMTHIFQFILVRDKKNIRMPGTKCNISQIDKGLTIRNFIVSKGMVYHIIPVKDIMIFFYEERNVFIVTCKNEIFLCDYDLSKISQESCSIFFRINRQVIINYKAIKAFNNEDNHNISIALHETILNPNLNLNVTKNRVAEFKHWISYECAICSFENIDSNKEEKG